MLKDVVEENLNFKRKKAKQTAMSGNVRAGSRKKSAVTKPSHALEC